MDQQAPSAASVHLGTDDPQAAPRVVAAGGELVFGRSPTADLCLDPNDTSMAPRAGRVVAEDGSWWVQNLSTQGPLSVVDGFGYRRSVPPGGRVPVDERLTVLVPGRSGEHVLVVRAASGQP